MTNLAPAFIQSVYVLIEQLNGLQAPANHAA